MRYAGEVQSGSLFAVQGSVNCFLIFDINIEVIINNYAALAIFHVNS